MTNTHTLESVRESRLLRHFKVKCPYCGKDLVISTPNLQKDTILFNPKKETYTYWRGGFGKEYERTGERFISSDPAKDVVKVHCCNCGHVWDEPVEKVIDGRCDCFGGTEMKFKLGEHSSEAARAFMEEHNHIEDLEKMGRSSFSAMGHQFTFTITPGGLGPLVGIKCNFCHATKDITCAEQDW